ncbi:RNA-binding protein-like protein, partial [Euroglyphus maynei]
MFNLNKSLKKLKSFLEKNDLQKKQSKISSSSSTKQTDHKIAKKIQNKRTKNDQSTDGVQERRGVVMIKNFPHGFYEQQMYEYFSQFGEVTRLKIIRSHKTGKPKNYGFIEFRFEDVAEIAAQTMDNYLMFDRIVKCKLLPPEKINVNIFKNWNKPFVSSVEKHRLAHNQLKTAKQELRMVQRHLRRIRKMNAILAQNDIEFECVIINRPLDLKAAADNVKIQSKHESIDSMPIEVIHM